jgi:putative ABC transport system permease protein
MMLGYQLRLAWKSLRRNPVLSLLIISGIGLGIAVAMTFVTARYVMARDPIPHKSENLYYVRLDFWNPDRPWDDERPEDPPDQLTYRDATNLLASTLPARQTAMYKANVIVHPAVEGQRPFEETARMCGADFFAMFEPPFQYGSGWDRAADAGPLPVLVISHELNVELFGGEDSVGRKLRIEDREFEVAGVLAPWRPLPKYYDMHNGPFDLAERLYLPLGYGREFELYSAGNTSGWGMSGDGYEAFLASENIWLQMWVELDDAGQREAYLDYLRRYADEQEAAGRAARQENIRLSNVREWLEIVEVVPDEVDALLIIALLFLAICSVNLIGILLGKFLARAPEVGVRRALGASRRSILAQHLVECQLVGLIGGLLGLGLSWVALRLIDRLFTVDYNMSLDLSLLVIGILLALLAAMMAGLYPAWRICRVAPSVYLKTQ